MPIELRMPFLRKTAPSFAFVFMLILAASSEAQVTLRKLSTDTFTNSTSQHATEVEPDTFAFGNTIVSAFQVGRIFGGGGADIGFATSTDGGRTWTSGFLPGITTFQGGGTASAVSDASVTYDAAHGVWIICVLPISNNGNTVAVSRSTDGLTWSNPITVTTLGDPDKNWIVCDNTPTSPFFGHCYVEWDDTSLGDQEEMNTSTDGGLTWGPALQTADRTFGIGGQPLVQPSGTVIVPYEGLSGDMRAFTSTNGGASWTKSVHIANITDHVVAGGLRTSALPSAEIDATGKIYVAWQDCRFRTACASNDIVMSTSANGATWTAPVRIPIDVTTSTVDHFIPGLGVDHATSGASAHLTLAYYFYPTAKCTAATCQLSVGVVRSVTGGTTWSAPRTLAGPMSLNSLPNTFSGLMVGDYISTSYVNGKAFPVFAVARAKVGTKFDEAMNTTPAGLAAALIGPEFSSRNDRPVPHAHSDHPKMQYYDLDHEHRIPPSKK